MKKKKNLTRRGMVVLLALTLILSMMPMATVWADDSGNYDKYADNLVIRDTDAEKALSGLVSDMDFQALRKVTALYVNVDMGEGHEALAAEVCSNWSGTISKLFPKMDISGMQVSGSLVTLAVPDSRLFTHNMFMTLFDASVIRAKTGKNIDVSIVDNKCRFVGAATHDITYYSSYKDIVQELEKSAFKKLQEGEMFYALWCDPVTEVNLSLDDLVCGTVVTSTFKDMSLTQDPKPSVATNDADYTVTQRLGNEKVDADLPLWTTEDKDIRKVIENALPAKSDDSSKAKIPTADEIKAFASKVQDGLQKLFKGNETSFTAKGDDTYIANIVLDSSFGKFFDKDTEVAFNINGEPLKAEEYSVLVIDAPYNCAFLQIHAKAVHDWDEGKVIKEPTIKADGEMFLTCKVCGETKTEPISNADVVAHYKELKAKYTPAKVKIKSVTAGKNKAVVKWNKTKKTTAYKVKLTNKKTGKVKNYTVKGTSKTLKKLTSNRKYSVKVRAYKKIEGYTFYGKWSKAKSFKTK